MISETLNRVVRLLQWYVREHVSSHVGEIRIADFLQGGSFDIIADGTLRQACGSRTSMRCGISARTIGCTSAL